MIHDLVTITERVTLYFQNVSTAAGDRMIHGSRESKIHRLTNMTNDKSGPIKSSDSVSIRVENSVSSSVTLA